MVFLIWTCIKKTAQQVKIEIIDTNSLVSR